MSKLTTLLRYLNTPKRYSSRKKIAKIQNKAVMKHIKFVPRIPNFIEIYKVIPTRIGVISPL